MITTTHSATYMKTTAVSMPDFLRKFLYVLPIIFLKNLTKNLANLLNKRTNDINIQAQRYLDEYAGSVSVRFSPKISECFPLIFPKNLIKNFANLLNNWTNDINIYAQHYLHDNDGSINIRFFLKVSVVFPKIFPKIK